MQIKEYETLSHICDSEKQLTIVKDLMGALGEMTLVLF